MNPSLSLTDWSSLTCRPRGGRRRNFGLSQSFKFLLGQKFFYGQIQCKFYVRIFNAKQIQIFLKNAEVCKSKFLCTFLVKEIENLTFMEVFNTLDQTL